MLDKRDGIRMRHQFVEFVPDELEAGVLYISLAYRTVSHRCCCGCGSEVITPISPVGWQITFNGEAVSLYPSIGNWSFACRSHYWIRENCVTWAPLWSDAEIVARRDNDRRAYQSHFDRPTAKPIETGPIPAEAGILHRLVRLITGLLSGENRKSGR